jgi:hypothetical protein
MSLFFRRKDTRVQSLVLKLLNAQCLKRTAVRSGPRHNSRVNLTLTVLVIPFENGRPQVHQAFMAVTKDFCNTGLSVVLDHTRGPDQAILGLRIDGEVTFIRAETKHLDSIGGGFFQLGCQLTEVVSPSKYPELASLSI